MDNKFYKNTFIVHHINPFKPEYNKKTIFLWNCPPLVKKKILDSNFEDPIIKNYFGTDYKIKLGLNKVEGENIFHQHVDKISNIKTNGSSINQTTSGGELIELTIDTEREREITFNLPNSSTDIPNSSNGISNSSNDIQGGDIEDNSLIIHSSRDDDIENFGTTEEEPMPPQETSDFNIDFDIDFNEASSDDIVSSSDKILDAEFDEGNSYVFDINLYPEDNILTVKNKIYLTCKIPIYRQLLYLGDNNVETFHEIYVNDILYTLSPLDDITKLYNMSVDKKLFLSRDSVRIKSLDEFRLLSSFKVNYVYLVDLKMYSDMLGMNKIKILDDKHYFDVMFYGFIRKYYPMLDYDAFKLYLTNEKNLLNTYPFLVDNLSNLEFKYSREKMFLDNAYTMKIKDIKALEKNIEIIAKNIKLGNNYNSNLNILNIRNVFDIISTNSSIVKLIAKFEFNNEVYEITKEHISHTSNMLNAEGNNINYDMYKTYLKFKNNGLVLYYVYDKTELDTKIATFVLFPNCKYYIIINNKEEDKVSFNKSIELAMNIVNKIIKIINENISVVLNKNISNFSLSYFTLNNIKFYTLDILMYYNVSISENKFNQYKNMFNELGKIGMLTLGNIQTNHQIFSKFYKSIFDYGDRKFIIKKDKEAKNYYDAYLDAGANSTWKLLFGGKKLNVTNSITRITFEMFNLVPEEFNHIYYYILSTLQNLSNIKSKSDTQVINKKNYIAKSDIKKLEELDPELYAQNLGKDKIYSRIVQKKNRPTIYTLDEVKKMSDKEKKNLVKYWNFTSNEPVYYACEDSSYKHFSFVTGKHPKGYCFPVCRNVKNKGKKMTQLYDTCMTDHCISKDKKSNSETSNLLKYKDELLLGKKYHLPDVFSEIFYMIDPDSIHFVTSTHSYLNVSNASLLILYSNMVEIKVPILITEIIKKLQSYNILDFEVLNIYFNSIEDLTNSLDLHFKKGESSYDSYWNLIFEEILLYLYNVCVINLTYDSKLFINMRNDINNFTNNKIIVTFNNNAVVYGKQSLFDFDNQFIQDILNIKNNLKLRTDNIVNIFTYDNLQNKLDTKKIKHIYVSSKKMNAMIYEDIYIALYNSPMIEHPNNIYNEIYNRSKHKVSWKSTYEFVKSLVSIEPIFVVYNPKLEEITDINSINQSTKVIGFNISNLYFWFSDVKLSDIKQEIPNPQIEIVNFEPHDINELIKNTQNTKNYIDNHLVDINFKIYYNNMFKMYKIATYNYILKNFKNKIKDNILKIIKSKNFDDNINSNITEISKLLEHKQDRDMIISLVNDYKNDKILKDDIISNIENNQFLYDIDNIKIFSTYDPKDIKDYLVNEGKKYVKLIKMDQLKLNKNISNIISTCSSGSKSSEFCDSGKLLILEDQYDDFVDVMAFNLKNEVYSYHDIININFNIIVDYFKFNKNPGEVIYLLS